MTSLAPLTTSSLSGRYASASSPLNPGPRSADASARDGHLRRPMFPTSRPLRPFAPAIATKPAPGKKGIKLIEPKGDRSHMFVLDLTPDELARNA